jgi:hypothetical protein
VRPHEIPTIPWASRFTQQYEPSQPAALLFAWRLRDAVISLENVKRRTLKAAGLRQLSQHHHHVYVVLLDPAAARIRKVQAENPNRNPALPCVYVGMTGLPPEQRFMNHKAGVKAASLVKRYGIRLLPELYTHLNPMPFEAAAQMEMDLAEDLRRAGYTVTGGH